MPSGGMARDELREATDATVRDPRAWLFEADRLKRAADLLGERFQGEANTWLKIAEADKGELRAEAYSLAPAYLLLAGYAVEDLAKGLIVASKKSDKTIKWVTTHHLSKEMVETAGVELLDGESDLVERLHHRVRWAGRYPAPQLKDARAFDETVRERGWWGNPLRVSSGDVAMVDALFGRMRRQLDEAASTSSQADRASRRSPCSRASRLRRR
jgi:hypothetical protein